MPAESRCSPGEIHDYLGGISGPLLDRLGEAIQFRSLDRQIWG